MFQRGASLVDEGRHAEALRVLRNLRIDYPESPLMPDILLLSAKTSLAQSDFYRARYFLQLVVDGGWTGPAAYESHILLADLYYEQRMFVQALEVYRYASNRLEHEARPEPGVRARVYVRIGEIAALMTGQSALARTYLGRVNPAHLVAEDLATYLIARRRAQWESLPTEALGLEDPNVSAIASDGDDLWVGTWNGGVSRLARSSRTHTVFAQGALSLVANTVRAITVTPREVWVGTYQGLSRYSKALSTWTEIPQFAPLGDGSRGAGEGSRVQAVLVADDRVLVGTLGQGLWVRDSEGWTHLGQDDLPGPLINSLGLSREWVLIGTMDRGLVVMRRSDGVLFPGIRAYPGVPARNITFAFEDSAGEVWVGTYGEGLYHVVGGLTTRYTTSNQGILDDWVMCGAESRRAVYVGTFGGGVAVFFRDAAPQTLGIDDGLTSLDIMSISCSRGIVYFGTLGGGVSVFHEELGQ